MLDLRRLRLLRELDARGTVHAAAAALGYTPSAVSQQLAVLEREAGIALLERVGRGVRLTDAGRVLVGHAEMLLAGVEAAEAELAASAGVVSGIVRVAAFQTAALRLVAPAVRMLAARHPALRLELVDMELEEAIPALERGIVDVALGDEYPGQPRPRPRDLDRVLLLAEEVRLALPAAHPLARRRRPPLAAFADAPWSVAHPGTGHHAMTLRMCRELGGFEPDLRHHTTDLLVMLELVAQGGVVSLLPELVGADRDPRVVLRTPQEGRIGREVFALHRAAGRERPALAGVLGALGEAARAWERRAD